MLEGLLVVQLTSELELDGSKFAVGNPAWLEV